MCLGELLLPGLPIPYKIKRPGGTDWPGHPNYSLSLPLPQVKKKKKKKKKKKASLFALSLFQYRRSSSVTAPFARLPLVKSRESQGGKVRKAREREGGSGKVGLAQQ